VDRKVALALQLKKNYGNKMQMGIAITANTEGMHKRVMIKSVAMRSEMCANSKIFIIGESVDGQVDYK